MRRKRKQSATSIQRLRRAMDLRHIDELLDRGLEGTFPASDPLSSLSTSETRRLPDGASRRPKRTAAA
jgi:hypothetical protein